MLFTCPAMPGGTRCAVLLTFDNFGEAYDLVRFGHAGGANADGVYAPRRGIERVLKLLDDYSVPATFFLEGWNVKKYSRLASEIVACGHEIGAHGWMHEPWSDLRPDEERDLILRTTVTIGEVIGTAPRGWRSPSGRITPHTLELLHRAGYVYDSSFGDEDVPYVMDIGHGSPDVIVEIPWSWSLDDAAYFAFPGVIRRPSEVAELWIDEFDAAYQTTGIFILVCHPRFIGRPARIRALEQLIEHIQSHEGVWFARCEEVAAATRSWENVPHYSAPDSLPTG